MSAETVAAIAENVVSQLHPTTASLINWHAGEPTAVPLRWYREATDALSRAKKGTPLQFSMQTNGIGLNDEWIEFLVATNTQVGLSIDGPQALHDLHRRTRKDRGTWHLAMAALQRLRCHGLDPSIITVVTADSLARVDELLEFYTEHKVSRVSLNFEEAEGANESSSVQGPRALQAAEAFLADFLRKIVQRQLPIQVREAERILGVLTQRDAIRFNDQVVPLANLTIDYRGGVYSFSPEFTEHASGKWKHLRLGSILEHSLPEIATSEKLRRLTAEVATGVAACETSCPIWRVCGGGAPVNRLSEHGSLAIAETQFCRLNVQAMVKALTWVLQEATPRAA